MITMIWFIIGDDNDDTVHSGGWSWWYSNQKTERSMSKWKLMACTQLAFSDIPSLHRTNAMARSFEHCKTHYRIEWNTTHCSQRIRAWKLRVRACPKYCRRNILNLTKWKRRFVEPGNSRIKPALTISCPLKNTHRLLPTASPHLSGRKITFIVNSCNASRRNTATCSSCRSLEAAAAAVDPRISSIARILQIKKTKVKSAIAAET